MGTIGCKCHCGLEVVKVLEASGNYYCHGFRHCGRWKYFLQSQFHEVQASQLLDHRFGLGGLDVCVKVL